MNTHQTLLSEEQILPKIYIVRGHKVMIDKDLSLLYGVETRVLNQAVKRNIERFPEDFMFQLTDKECQDLISQFVISSWGGNRKLPYAFTEQGIAMLSSVLNSANAISVNIQIMRIFTRTRSFLHQTNELKQAIQELRAQTGENTQHIEQLFTYLDQFIDKLEDEKPRAEIGFRRS